MNTETKRAYSSSPLAFATPRRFQNSPLAFGEGGMQEISGLFLLESMTDKEKTERLSSLSLDPDGNARLAQPPISSYYPPPVATSYTMMPY